MTGDTNSRLDYIWEKSISITDRVNWIGDAMGRILSDICGCSQVRQGMGWREWGRCDLMAGRDFGTWKAQFTAWLMTQWMDDPEFVKARDKLVERLRNLRSRWLTQLLADLNEFAGCYRIKILSTDPNSGGD